MEKRLPQRHKIGILWWCFALLPFVISVKSTGVEVPTQIIVEGEGVYLPDIFQEIPPELLLKLQGVKILEPPPHGKPFALKKRQIIQLAKRYQIPWVPSLNFQNTHIHRFGHRVSKEDVAEKLRAHIPNDETMNVHLQNTPRIFLGKDEDFSIQNFNLNPQSNIFTADALYPVGNTTNPRKERLYGKIVISADAPVPNRLIYPGDVIQKSDITWTSVPQNQIQSQHIVNIDTLIGQTPRRVLRPYKLFRASDLKRPTTIKKGTVVPVEYKNGNIRLVLKATALQNGSTGDTITFQGYDKKRVISATVVGPNKAEIKGVSHG